MTQPVQMYRSDAGSLHDTEFDSLKADMRHMLVKSGDINEASADKFVEWVCQPRQHLYTMTEMLRSLYDKHPEARKVSDER